MRQDRRPLAFSAIDRTRHAIRSRHVPMPCRRSFFRMSPCVSMQRVETGTGPDRTGSTDTGPWRPARSRYPSRFRAGRLPEPKRSSDNRSEYGSARGGRMRLGAGSLEPKPHPSKWSGAMPSAVAKNRRKLLSTALRGRIRASSARCEALPKGVPAGVEQDTIPAGHLSGERAARLVEPPR